MRKTLKRLLPSFGRITHYYAPGGPGVRVDTAIYTGYEIPPYYDSMCLKLVVWALTWDEVIARGKRALDDMRLHGIKPPRSITSRFWIIRTFVTPISTPALCPTTRNC